jgi:hypothetical protein
MPQPRVTLKRAHAYLSANGETQANALASALGVTPGTLSSAVKAGLLEDTIVKRKDGHNVFYSIGAGESPDGSEFKDGLDGFNAALWADGDLVLHNVEMNDDGSTITLSRRRVALLRRLLLGVTA